MFKVNRFSELLKQLPRGAFDRAVKQFGTEKHRKGFSTWAQLVTMVYAQMAQLSTLRTLAASFNAHSAHHYHLGCTEIRRSTLAQANERADWRVFQAVAQQLMQQMHRGAREQGEALMQLIDSSSITLKGRGFDGWTQATRTRHTQGMKLHVLFASNERVPLDCWMSAANVNDLEYARTLPIHAGVIYVFDKAYCDYSWWWQLTTSAARFVSRFKRNARIEVSGERAIARAARGTILKDQDVFLTNKNPGGGRRNPYGARLRRIEVARENKPPLVLVTNDFKRSALSIADTYKARWQIELFFKWLKQNLKIKRFLGRSENAVRIQILCALIAYLLTYLHAKAQGIKNSLSLHLIQLRSTLFQRSQSEHERHRKWRERKSDYELRQFVLL
jgi:putative transposase